MRHAALYLRISKADGRTERIEAQEKWGREYAAQTWPDLPVVVYRDNDRSAAKDNSTRPGYLALREAIASGQVAQLWAKEQSRIERKTVDWFQFAAFAAGHGLTHIHLRAEGIQDVRGVVAGIKAVLNAEEIRLLIERIGDRLTKNAEAGQPPGSQPFGYRHGVTDKGVRTYVIQDEEAEAIRWAADRLLAGWGLTRIARELGERGLHGAHRLKVIGEDGEPVTDDQGNVVTKPGRITPATVRSWLTKPTFAGRRVHQGRDLGPGSGNWPAILDETTWQACRAKLTAPRIIRQSDGRMYPVTSAHQGQVTGRKYLLSGVGGVAVCGVCFAPLLGSMKQIKGQRRPDRAYLLCHPSKRRPDGTRAGGCIGIMLDETERFVVDRLFAELDKPAFVEAFATDHHTARREEIADGLLGVEQQREELAREWGRHELTMAEWKVARHELDEQEAQLRTELGAVPPAPVNVDITTIRRAWPHMELEEQRQILRMFIAQVTIKRAVPGRKGFDANRVEIEWAKV